MSKRYTLARNADGRYAKNPTTPRKNLVPDGNPQTGDDSEAPQELAQTNSRSDSLIAEALTELLSYTDGWLRLTPDMEHKTLFLKFKFRRGTWQGYYVMSVVEPHLLGLGLDLLLGKVIAVHAGAVKPTKDTPYE